MEEIVDIRAAYQPVFSTKSGRVAFFESTLRVDGTIDPQFHIRLIRLAEHLGFTHYLDHRMLEIACYTLKSIDTMVSTNVSQATVEADGPQLIQTIISSQVAPRLIVEITESSWAERSLLADFAQEVRRSGSRLAVDDFGTGHCDLGLISAVRPDIIKIVLDNDEYRNRRKVIEAVEIAKSIQATIVVEKVDSIQKVSLAVEYGIAYMQGFLLARPVVLADVPKAMQMTVSGSIAGSRPEILRTERFIGPANAPLFGVAAQLVSGKG